MPPAALIERAGLGGTCVNRDETRGMMKALVERPSGRILGGAVLGMQGGEIAAMLHIAMIGGMSFDQRRDAPLAHPTLAESLNNLFGQVEL